MTFPEAGIQILEKAGHPLNVQEIVAKAIQDGLLSHVGQIPEQTMRERLFALARRSADRKLVVVGPSQFALIDWGLPEDVEAIAALETADEVPAEKPLRGKERHPPVSKAGGFRGESGREASPGRSKKKRRLPPLSTVVAELLGSVGAEADIESLLARGRDKGLMSEDLSRETLLNALGEENRRRTKAGQPAAFQLDGQQVTLLTPEVLEGSRPKARAAESEAEGKNLAAAAAGEHAPPAQALESRRQAARHLRRRVQELSNGQVERLALLLLSRAGYRDCRPVRPVGAEHERLFVARRKLGLTELRFLCQVLPTGKEISREGIQLLREWMVEAEAHAAVVIGPGEATREARQEAQRLGQPLLSLLCADAFVEELVVREIGVVSYQAVAVDDPFWRNFRRASDLKSKPEGSARPERSPRSRSASDAEASAEETTSGGEEVLEAAGGSVLAGTPSEAAPPAADLEPEGGSALAEAPGPEAV